MYIKEFITRIFQELGAFFFKNEKCEWRILFWGFLGFAFWWRRGKGGGVRYQGWGLDWTEHFP